MLSIFALAACTTPTPAEQAPAPTPIRSCAYVNSFSGAAECRDYRGEGWTADEAADDCAAPMPGARPGALTTAACDRGDLLAECVIDRGTPEEQVLVFTGDECEGLGIGCSFAGGDFQPAPACTDAPTPPPITSEPFTPFEQICTAPLDGAPGQSADGDVCTWQAISGATEEGRRFGDYADCEVVRTQRPYIPYEVTADTGSDDSRLDETDWVVEYDWVTRQVEATACVCCHSTVEAPNGTSGWYLEAEPIWTDTLDDDGMAMLAGWVDSSAFGAFPAHDNNGFSRDTTGMPSTDPDWLAAFFRAELLRRGKTEADFVETAPFGGPLYDQLTYSPSDCDEGVGMDNQGKLTWTGGDARYLYVLEPNANAPGVPPNLDLPTDTIWRMDVDYPGMPFPSGVTYGATDDGTVQRFPSDAAPASLVSGERYYLYVLADIYRPLARCLFTAP